MFKKGIIFVDGKQLTPESNWKIPYWIKITAGWWSEDKIPDEDFLNALENLVKRKIIII